METIEYTIKKEDDEEFEFFLKMNAKKEQLLTKVVPNGPADKAGARDDDRLIEVNGTNVEDMTHEGTVDLIRKAIPGNKVTFKVKRSSKKEEEAVKPNKSKASKPRICKLVKKDGQSFGFNLKGFAAREKQAHVIENIVEGSPADKAGLMDDDRVIRVGKQNVEKLTHQQLVQVLRKSGNQVTLLVVDKVTYHHFRAMKKKITEKDAVMATSSSKPQRSQGGSPHSDLSNEESDKQVARQLHVVPSDEGMGFFLRKKEDNDEEFVGGVEKSGSGYVCGLRENDRIVGVNGVSVRGKTHEEIVELLKKNKHHVVMVVLSPKTLKLIESKGVGSLGSMETSNLEKPRIVKLERGDDGYGFFLKMEKGKPHHVLTDIEENSVADKSGIKNNEVLASVNGHSVTKATHKECVDKIKESGNSVSLTVGSMSTMDTFYKLNIEVNDEFIDSWPEETCFSKFDIGDFVSARSAASNDDKEEHLPRLCHLVKDQHSYSFYLRDEEGVHVLEQVEEEGAAYKAGVREGDVIIEVNGVNVLEESHDEVVTRIREKKDNVTFLVADEKTRNHFKAKGIVITAALLKHKVEEAAQPPASDDQPKPRYCHLVKDRTFGFHLTNDQNCDRPGQYVRQVAEGGVAEVAGIKEGDRIIEINSTNIEDKNHQEVVAMIVASGKEVNFLVVDEETDVHYKNLKVPITMSLLTAVAMTPAEDDKQSVASEKASVTESVHSVEVHAEPEKPEIVVDEPAEDKEDSDKEEDSPLREAAEDLAAVAVLKEVIDQEEEEEAVEEAVEELKEEIQERIEEELEDKVGEEAAEEIAEKAAEEIVEEMVEEAKEEAKEEAVEEVLEEMREEVREEIAEEIREEIKEEIKDEIREEIREEIIEDVVENAYEDAIEEKRETEEEMRERLKEELKEQMREEEEQRLREEEERKAREEEERKAREEEERKAREEKESQEEMMARIREEVRKEMEAEKAAAAIAAIPVPPSPTLSSKSTNREAAPSNATSNAPSNVTTPRKEEPKVIQPQVSINEVKQVQLKPVNRVQETPDRHDDQAEEENPRPVRMSVRDRMAMFNGGGKPRYTPPKVDSPVVVNGNVNTLEKVTEAVVKSPTLTSPTKKKRPFTFASANQMSFKIVESTPTIN